jgi:predicted PurR-regulated permease PerM
MPQDMAAEQAGSASIRSATVMRIMLIVIGSIALAAALWTISDVLLLAFGAIIVAILLRAASAPLKRNLPVSDGVALAIAGLLLLSLLAGAAVVFGNQISAELSELSSRIPSGVQSIEQTLGVQNLRQQLRDQLSSSASSIFRNLTTVALTATSAAANAVLLVIAGVFFALKPQLYRDGFLLLFPRDQRGPIGKTLAHAGRALQQWLLGQLISMTLVGILMGIALWLVGLPSPFALGLIAGLAEFVPLLGPIIGGIAPLLLAFGQGGTTVLWTLLVILLVQQVESNMIQPLVQRRMVSLPPALTLFSVLAFGALFGLPGLLLATPLTVVAFIAVKELYLRHTLGEPVSVPGEDK